MGEPYPDEVIRAAMLLRANALAKGYSGARIETVELLIECLNRGVLPRVPARGSVGASGDLAPLAHLALPLVGEGQAWFDGTLLRGEEALAAAGLEPIRLAAKEGLSLINGTQFMAAMATLGARPREPARPDRRSRMRALARGAAGVADELPPGDPRGPTAARASWTPPRTCIACSKARRSSSRTAGATRCRTRTRCGARPRCTGRAGICSPASRRPSRSSCNAATDNPLVLVDEGMVVSNGNFHGQPLAFGLDTLAMAVAELANISERRVERLVNPSLSDGLPPFLTREGGLNSGFMIPQYVAASLVSENKSLCHPASVDSIPTSAGQEDHVSMGNAAGLKAMRVLANAELALAIELLAGAQAIEFLAPLEPAPGVRATHDAVREHSERVREDRSLSDDIERVAAAIRDGSILAAAEAEIGPLQ